MSDTGEVAYQELTITVKDVVTDKVTTITGRVRDLYVKMIYVEPPDNDILIDRPTQETVKVHLTGQWVMRGNMHFLLTVLDEPIGEKVQFDPAAPMDETLLRLFGKGWQEVPYFGMEEKNQLLRRITRARLYLNQRRKDTFPIELDFEIGEEDAGVIRLNVRGPRTIAVPDGRHPTG